MAARRGFPRRARPRHAGVRRDRAGLRPAGDDRRRRRSDRAGAMAAAAGPRLSPARRVAASPARAAPVRWDNVSASASMPRTLRKESAVTRLLRPLLLAALLASCANQYEARRQYLSQFVGRPESDLVLALGVPNRSYETGGIKYLAFDDRRGEFVPGTPVYWPPFLGWGPRGLPPP